MWAEPPAATISLSRLLQLLDRAGDQQHRRAGVGDLDRGRPADPRGGAGDEDDLAAHGAGQRAVLEEVGIEVALPVVPDPGRVALQRRHLDAGPFQRLLGTAGVEARRVIDVGQDRGRQAELAEDRLHDPLARREELQGAAHDAGRRLGHLGPEPDRHLRRIGRLGEEVDDLARGSRVRIGEVEGAAVEFRLVGDVVDRRGDVVDRDDVDLAAFDPDGRQPGGQHPARPLQCLEEVIGPVDLVDLTGSRVADDDPRPVDAPGAGRFAHQPLGLVLGPEVGVVVEPLRLLEHVLVPPALVETRGGDRADLVEAAGLDRTGELERVPGPLDVGDLLGLGTGGDVVDRGEMEKVLDLAPHRHQVLLGDRQPGLGQVAGHRDDPRPVGAPGVAQLLQPAPRSSPHQGVDRALALQQPVDQIAADESSGAGHEVAHRVPAYLDRVPRRPVS